MDIGRQQRIIQVEPEPLITPTEEPADPAAPSPPPERAPEEVPAGA